MANDALAAWSQKFLKAIAAWDNNVKASNAKNKKSGKFGRTYSPSATGLNELKQVCDDLASILDAPNKTTILSSLKIIRDGLTIGRRGDLTESGYVQFSDWYNANIKPLL